MGEHELQEALRGKARETIRELWQAAEAAVAERRAEIDARQAALRDTAERQLAAAAAVVLREVLATAERAVRQRQLVAEQALRERLHAAAMRVLPELGAGDRRRLWRTLAAELPPIAWQRIRVHPDDLSVARQFFPTVEVIAEPALGGGLVAETADGRIVIDNALTGRLARAWPDLLAPLFAAINEEVDRDAAGSAATD
jgi:vacuolar-type H+-ATPase subunit E/Vma4